jgi:lipoteichoic acid synthase
LFALFFSGLQQDLKIFLFAPMLCAIFRFIFLWVFWPYKSMQGKKKAVFHCFRYGFWWGMDFNAYVFLFSLLLVSLPGVFFPAYFAVGDMLRTAGVLFYAVVLYGAFVGKLIFYEHYHDIYNDLVWLGKNAEKHNLIDVFFHENHGVWVLLGYIPFLGVSWLAIQALLGLPSLELPVSVSVMGQYAFNTVVVLVAVAFFYYCRFGGTFRHENKPEWDTIPSVVKKNIFLARATVDDLIALENVWKHPLQEILTHTDEDDIPIIDSIMPMHMQDGAWQRLDSPAEAFIRQAKGARIRSPKHIFLIVGESYAQMPLDDIYTNLHLCDGARSFRADPHTVSLDNFLPAGMLSRPSIVSLMTGIFDARLELNEREAFWRGTVATSLPLQLKKLGYRSIYWYGGNATYGNFNQYAPAVGFDEVMAAADFCPPDAPRTWVGVYDHIFLEQTAAKIRHMDEQPTFHFIYTTSNHGPYKMDLAQYGYDAEKVMPDAPESLKKSHAWQQQMGTYWYSDQAISRFVKDMQQVYPDSLIIVTGDHAAIPVPMDMGIITRTEVTFREEFCTSFAMYHQDITKNMLAGNTIGGHMNILPTIFELIAPRAFRYYSLFPALLEPIDHIVTPYHWLTRDAIGPAEKGFYQGLEATGAPVETLLEASGKGRFIEETEGYKALSGWLVRHPDILRAATKWL